MGRSQRSCYGDWHVPYPTKPSLLAPALAATNESNDGKGRRAAPRRLSAAEQRKWLVERYESLGYEVMAWTRTFYGQVTEEARKAMPDMVVVDTGKPSAASKSKKRGREETDTLGGCRSSPCGSRGIRQWRRVNVVVEEVSQLQNLTTRNGSILEGYDIVAVSPRNEPVFTALCSSIAGGAAMAVDVVMLEYGLSSGSSIFPFGLRASHLQQVMTRSKARPPVLFELCYGPVVTEEPPSHRGGGGSSHMARSFVRALAEWNSATRFVQRGSIAPSLLLSCGGRTVGVYDEKDSDVRVGSRDVGPLAIRSPHDVANLLVALGNMTLAKAMDTVTTSPGELQSTVLGYQKQNRTNETQQQSFAATIHSSAATVTISSLGESQDSEEDEQAERRKLKRMKKRRKRLEKKEGRKQGTAREDQSDVEFVDLRKEQKGSNEEESDGALEVLLNAPQHQSQDSHAAQEDDEDEAEQGFLFLGS